MATRKKRGKRRGKRRARRNPPKPVRRCPVGTEIRTLIFDMAYFTRAEAERWARAHGYGKHKIEALKTTYRIKVRRGLEPVGTITLAPGLKALVGCPVPLKPARRRIGRGLAKAVLR